jgi:hypothetical protein
VSPAQQLDILGVTFDLVRKACRLAVSFQASLASSLLMLSTHTAATKRLLSQVAGSVAWGAVAVPALFPLANPVFDAMRSAGPYHTAWDTLVPVSEPVLVALRAIATVAAANPWCTFRALQANHLRYSSDASSRFICFHASARHIFCRALSPEETDTLDIPDKEALALIDAFTDARAHGRDALFLVDAKALAGALSKGRSNNALFNACCQHKAAAQAAGLAWKTQWIPTDTNKADLPTRPEKLPPGVTHPEHVRPGAPPVLVPAGWSSPALRAALRSGLTVRGSTIRIPACPFLCTWLLPSVAV